MSQSTPVVTDAVRQAAREGAFGTWIWSGRVNARRESGLLFPGAAVLLACFAGESVLLTQHGISLTAKVALSLFALLFGLVGLAMTITGVTYWLSGPWLLHRFEHGFVMQRSNRAPLAVRNDAARAELFEYTEHGDSTGTSVENVLLRVTPHGGAPIAMSEPLGATADALVGVGERCGAGAPVPIDHADAVVMLAEESWQLRGPVFSRASILKRRRS